MASITTGAKQKIVPFLWFDGKAEEAAAFYTSVFKDSRVLTTSRYPEDAPPPLPAGTVMTVEFEIAGQPFIALNGGPGFPFTQAVSLVVNCEDQAEIDYYWEKLTAGGGRPVQCGWLRDRFGLSWQIVPAMLWPLFKDAAKRDRVVKAVWQMVKLDIAKLKAAAEGR
jgi:predicted 3-demethylubiquinone-9 3-methyltransferase (glyoxalase superfamily)